MVRGVNRRWPRARRLASCPLTAVSPSTGAPRPDTPEPAVLTPRTRCRGRATGSAPGGLPSPPAGDDTPQEPGAVGRPERSRRSAPCPRAGQHVARNPCSSFASNLDDHGFGFGAELAAEAPAFTAATTIAKAAKAADPRAASGASGPNSSYWSPSAGKSLITSAPSAILRASASFTHGPLVDSGGLG
jgi:hypothetical protein